MFGICDWKQKMKPKTKNQLTRLFWERYSIKVFILVSKVLWSRLRPTFNETPVQTETQFNKKLTERRCAAESFLKAIVQFMSNASVESRVRLFRTNLVNITPRILIQFNFFCVFNFCGVCLPVIQKHNKYGLSQKCSKSRTGLWIQHCLLIRDFSQKPNKKSHTGTFFYMVLIEIRDIQGILISFLSVGIVKLILHCRIVVKG